MCQAQCWALCMSCVILAAIYSGWHDPHITLQGGATGSAQGPPQGKVRAQIRTQAV